MTIQGDAEAVMKFMYEEYVNSREISPQSIRQKFSQWGGDRIDRAIKYLRDDGSIEIILMLGSVDGVQNFILKKMTPSGIQGVEKKSGKQARSK